jgi:hypothetical protein
MSDGVAELPVLIGPGGNDPEMLLLISEPDARGMVSTRRWSASDWSAVPTLEHQSAKALFKWLESAHRANRTMNQSLTHLRSWLRQ